MRQGAGNAISIMGSRPTSNNFMIDGTSNIDTALGTPAAILSIDALEEFKEQTKTYSAEYGFSANQINLVSKSGTNQFHGTLFGFMRNDSLDAKNFFDPPDQEKPKLDQKQFGGVVTGPDHQEQDVLPGQLRRHPHRPWVQLVSTVPNPDELAGRFTSTIIDPTTGQPFPNNTIPASRFSRLAQVALQNRWYPAPNSDSPLGNYSGRADASPDPEPVHGPDRPGPGPLRPGLRPLHGHDGTTTGDHGERPGHLGPDLRPERQELAGLAHLAHPQQPGELVPLRPRLGRRSPACRSRAPSPSSTHLAITGIFQNIPDDQRNCPNIGIQSYSGTGGPVNAYSASTQPMWDISNTTTWIKGNHTFNVGVNYRRWWLQRDLATDFTGNFAFGDGFTVTGNPVADFLLGYYTGACVFQPAGFSVPGAGRQPA